jgi:hypothetical protein
MASMFLLLCKYRPSLLLFLIFWDAVLKSTSFDPTSKNRYGRKT